MISFIGLIFCNIFNISAEWLKMTFCVEILAEVIFSLLYMKHIHGGIFHGEPKAEIFDDFEDVESGEQIDAPKFTVEDYEIATCWQCPRIKKAEPQENPYVEGTVRWYAYEERKNGFDKTNQ